jgi:hypothetical protein
MLSVGPVLRRSHRHTGRRLVPTLTRHNLSQSLLPKRRRRTRIATLNCRNEMLRKIRMQRLGGLAGCVVRSNVANDSKASPRQGDEAQHRDGKENLHAPKKNTKCHAFVQLIPIPLLWMPATAQKAGFPARPRLRTTIRYELGTLSRQSSFPLDDVPCEICT